jgi:hypothetical protein
MPDVLSSLNEYCRGLSSSELNVFACDEYHSTWQVFGGFQQARELLLSQLRASMAPTPSLIVGLHKNPSQAAAKHTDARFHTRVLEWPGCQYLYLGDASSGLRDKLQSAVVGAGNEVPANVRAQIVDARELAKVVLHCLQNQSRALDGWDATVRSLRDGERLNSDFAAARPEEEQRYRACADLFSVLLKELNQGIAGSFVQRREEVRHGWSELNLVCQEATEQPIDRTRFDAKFQQLSAALAAQIRELQIWDEQQ